MGQTSQLDPIEMKRWKGGMTIIALGASTKGAGGVMTIAAGATTASDSTAGGGALGIAAGAAGGTGTGGALSLAAGASNSGDGLGGAVSVAGGVSTAGAGAGAGDTVDFNSISDNLPNVLATNVRHWVDSEYQHRNTKAMDWRDWSYCSEPCPQQENDYDCGVLMLLCALHITRLGAPSSPLPFRFSRHDTVSVRWWLIHCVRNDFDSAGTPYELKSKKKKKYPFD